MEALARRSGAVGVDRDDGVGVGLLTGAPALVDARARRRGRRCRVSTTRTPRAVRRCATRCATSKVKACSAYPASVEVPVVLQAFVPPRPSGTWRLIAAGAPALPPLCPGSRTTTRARADVAAAETGVDGLGDPGAALVGPAHGGRDGRSRRRVRPGASAVSASTRPGRARRRRCRAGGGQRSRAGTPRSLPPASPGDLRRAPLRRRSWRTRVRLAGSRPARMRVTTRGDRECNRASPTCR